MKEYTILIGSDTKTAGTNSNDLTYNFNWSIIPEGEYELSFNFLSEPKQMTGTAITDATQAVMVSVNVPLSGERYKTTTTGNASSSSVIGLIQMVGVDGFVDTATDYAIRQWKSLPDNPPIKLKGSPQGNTIKVELLQNDESLAAHYPTKYQMVLKLRHIC
tara:strand:+ start:9569 stop:10051 length:483 start_codon:yes stop_codon:yes gene_type:complete